MHKRRLAVPAFQITIVARRRQEILKILGHLSQEDTGGLGDFGYRRHPRSVSRPWASGPA